MVILALFLVGLVAAVHADRTLDRCALGFEAFYDGDVATGIADDRCESAEYAGHILEPDVKLNLKRRRGRTWNSHGGRVPTNVAEPVRIARS